MTAFYLFITACSLTSFHTVDRVPNAKKTKRTIPSGVKSNWDKDEVLIPPPEINRTRSSSSNASGWRSASSVPAEPGFRQGGISSGEDELEHDEIVNQTAVPPVRYRVCQINLKFILYLTSRINLAVYCQNREDRWSIGTQETWQWEVSLPNIEESPYRDHQDL